MIRGALRIPAEVFWVTAEVSKSSFWKTVQLIRKANGLKLRRTSIRYLSDF